MRFILNLRKKGLLQLRRNVSPFHHDAVMPSAPRCHPGPVRVSISVDDTVRVNTRRGLYFFTAIADAISLELVRGV